MSPRLASARTSSPAACAASTVRSSACHPGAPRRSKQASWGLTATQAAATASIAASQCTATAVAASAASAATGHRRAGSGSRPRTICDSRSATAAARRSPKWLPAMRPSCHAALADRLAGHRARRGADRRAAPDLGLPGLRRIGRRGGGLGGHQPPLMAGPQEAEGRGQQRAALVSVGAAAALIALKLVTGLVTGSLGLIAEAAHSGTDLVAALLTLFAIRVAIRPADREHHYGHGKAEHLAALAESSFLMLVSAFLAYQAIHRLVESGTHHVDAKWWAFVVIAIVIAVDASRAVISLRASRRYHSPALASNALHFASDLAGSVAVLIGLAFVAAGKPAGDAVAALIVAVIVMTAAARLAKVSADVLMDRASAEAEAAVTRALE